jgi:hypothetical protein
VPPTKMFKLPVPPSPTNREEFCQMLPAPLTVTAPAEPANAAISPKLLATVAPARILSDPEPP